MKLQVMIIKRIISYFKFLKYKRVFGNIHSCCNIVSPLRIDGGNNIYIGKNVFVAYKTWLAALPLTGEKECRLELHDGVTLGHFNHIYATKKIILEQNVLTADKVYISDNLHGYEDVSIPIKNQPIIQNGEVIIGENSWLGENVCVLGASIGKHCIIGSNSVVTKNIPSYCVAVGVPAKIIKRYNFDTKCWHKTDSNGNFIK